MNLNVLFFSVQVDKIMKSLRQAFNSAWQAVGSTAACENCPLHKLHRLCQELEGIVIFSHPQGH